MVNHILLLQHFSISNQQLSKRKRGKVCVLERKRERERENHMRLKINKNLVPANNNDVKTKKH